MSKLDLGAIRRDFPTLHPNKDKAIYLDNACMSLRPNSVIDAISSYYREHPSCHNRSVHRYGERTTERYAAARVTVQKFLGAGRSDEIVFTRNATESLNAIASSLTLGEGDVVVSTDAEHNSNTIPWMRLRKTKGIIYKKVPIRPDGVFPMDELRALLQGGQVKLVTVLSTSHFLGISTPLEEIGKLAHAHGALFMVDAAQSFLHEQLDVRKLDVDFLALSFHKLLGPSGIGALYAKKSHLETFTPWLLGGETVDDVDEFAFQLSAMPARFEAGLQNYGGALGAAAAIDYLNGLSYKAIREHLAELNRFVVGELNTSPRFHHIGPADPAQRAGVVNFFIDGLDSGELSILLDRTKRIMTRSGVHCAHAWYRLNGLPASLRASFAFYNTMEEAETFVRTVKDFLRFH
ncbi:MAG: aminotransferase class V-fold PLP-dependent enzyme [Myxococcota bacterium]